MLEAVAAWVEKGEVADAAVASRFSPEKGLERTFRLCAEPKRAMLKKSGLDPTKAENWECRTSAADAS